MPFPRSLFFKTARTILCIVLFTISSTSLFSQEKRPAQYKLMLSPGKEYQTIAGFGASDAWRCEYVGKYWPLQKKEAIADLLFSMDTAKTGTPIGIGLSLWRFYIGAGSAEQGDKSGIRDPDRRAECFLNADGSYNWLKQAGQQWFLQAARKRGVEKFLAFTIAPPVSMAANGKAYPAEKSSHMNILPGKIPAYARFLADVTAHFRQKGINFHYISPVNEPQWDWSKGTQEGTAATNREIHALAGALSEELTTRNLSTSIVVGEAGQLNHLYEGKDSAENQVEAFWKPGSIFSFREIPRVAQVISGHSYFTTWPVEKLGKTRRELSAKLAAIPNPPAFWQTEFCILENGITEYDINRGRKRDTGINTALYFARVIHADLVEANAASWQFWTALSDADFKDGLIYLDRGTDSSGTPLLNRNLLRHDGFFRASKTLWCVGNFSRFVRPGMKRIESGYTSLTTGSPDSSLLVSAYKDAGGKLVLVIINYSETEQSLLLPAQQVGFLQKQGFEVYTTSARENLSKKNIPDHIIPIGPRTVVTIIGRLK